MPTIAEQLQAIASPHEEELLTREEFEEQKRQILTESGRISPQMAAGVLAMTVGMATAQASRVVHWTLREVHLEKLDLVEPLGIGCPRIPANRHHRRDHQQRWYGSSVVERS